MKKLLFGLLTFASVCSFASPHCSGVDNDGNEVEVSINGGDDSLCIFPTEVYKISVVINEREEYRSNCGIYSDENDSYSTGDLQFYLTHIDNGFSLLYLNTEDHFYNTIKIKCQ